MKVRFKKLSAEAVMPKKAHKEDAGFDLTAIDAQSDNDGNVVFRTGIAVEIPENYVGLVFPRSSNAKTDLILTNSVGVIDSNYRGEITLKYRPYSSMKKGYNFGDRVGQLIIMPYPEIEFEEADTLSETDRGNGGYGSTGK